MPSIQEHFDQADENRAFLDTAFSNHDQPRWRVIVSFYAALHLMDAYLDRQKTFHPESHFERMKELQGLAKGRRLEWNIYTAYRSLNESGHKARYDCTAISSDLADRAQNDWLVRIEDYVHRHVRPGRF
jgi:hypothetical protein